MIETAKTRLETRMLKEVRGKLEDAKKLLSILYDNACEVGDVLNENKTLPQEAKDKQMALVDLYTTAREAVEEAVGYVDDIL
jgi:ATP phosphoribosyltransferase regulatory subunit HisZ